MMNGVLLVAVFASLVVSMLVTTIAPSEAFVSPRFYQRPIARVELARRFSSNPFGWFDDIFGDKKKKAEEEAAAAKARAEAQKKKAEEEAEAAAATAKAEAEAQRKAAAEAAEQQRVAEEAMIAKAKIEAEAEFARFEAEQKAKAEESAAAAAAAKDRAEAQKQKAEEEAAAAAAKKEAEAQRKAAAAEAAEQQRAAAEEAMIAKAKTEAGAELARSEAEQKAAAKAASEKSAAATEQLAKEVEARATAETPEQAAKEDAEAEAAVDNAIADTEAQKKNEADETDQLDRSNEVMSEIEEKKYTQEAFENNSRIYGAVQWYNGKKGYGFIKPYRTKAEGKILVQSLRRDRWRKDPNEKKTTYGWGIFVYHGDIQAPDSSFFRKLYPLEAVEMDISEDKQGRMVAKNVTGLDGNYVKTILKQRKDREEAASAQTG